MIGYNLKSILACQNPWYTRFVVVRRKYQETVRVIRSKESLFLSREKKSSFWRIWNVYVVKKRWRKKEVKEITTNRVYKPQGNKTWRGRKNFSFQSKIFSINWVNTIFKAKDWFKSSKRYVLGSSRVREYHDVYQELQIENEADA